MPSARRVIIFDMDGTLTRPNLDFDRMREEIGVAAGSLLEVIERMPPEDRRRAERILLVHESAAAANSVLQPGAAEVIDAIRAAGMSVALMTRNTRDSVRVFEQRHGIRFDLVRTREDGVVKPSPQPVHEICAALDGRCADAWVIGDFHYDVLCGAAAGARTVLLLDPEEPRPQWAGEADYVIHRLMDLLPLLGLSPGPN